MVIHWIWSLCDTISKLKPIYTKPGPYLSDHCTISTLINIKKEPIPIREVTFRKFKDINPEILIQEDVELDSINGDTSDEILTKFNSNIVGSLDKHVPLKK